jgi:hypothetical protein
MIEMHCLFQENSQNSLRLPSVDNDEMPAQSKHRPERVPVQNGDVSVTFNWPLADNGVYEIWFE